MILKIIIYRSADLSQLLIILTCINTYDWEKLIYEIGQ